MSHRFEVQMPLDPALIIHIYIYIAKRKDFARLRKAASGVVAEG